MVTIVFDKPRSMNPEALVRELRGSSHCAGLEILLWDEEITVEESKSGDELTVKIDPSKLEIKTEGASKALAEKVATALQAQGLRRRPPPGSGKAKKAPRPTAPPPERP